jgi:Tol biopolymer transport system component
MNDVREALERVGEAFEFPELAFQRMMRRHDRKLRKRRLASALVAIIVSIAAISALVRAFSAPPNTATPTPSERIGGGVLPVAFVDLRTGQATALPESVTSLPGATAFVASPGGERLAFLARGRSGFLEVHVSTIDGREIQQLTHGHGDAGSPRWSPDALHIVFLRSSGSDRAIVVARIGTEEERELFGPAAIWGPSFGPVGSTILFTKASGLQGYRPLGLWSQPMDGSPASLVVANAALGSISPDGTRIAYHRTGAAGTTSVFGPGLSFIRVHGDVHNPPLPPGPHPHFFQEEGADGPAVWSPDGSMVAYENLAGTVTVNTVATGALMTFRGSQVSWLDDDTLIIQGYEGAKTTSEPKPSGGIVDALVNVTTGRATPLPDVFSSVHGAYAFEASPDGRRLLFLGSSDSTTDLYVANLDGTALRNIASFPIRYPVLGPGWARWSPDGSTILFLGCCGSYDLVLIDVRSGRQHSVTYDQPEYWAPTFGPDGRTILFTKWSHGLELWSVPSDGGKPSLVLRNAAFGSYSPDGSTIAFHRTRYQTPAFCGECAWVSFAISFAPSDGSEQPEPAKGGLLGPMPNRLSQPVWSPDGSKVAYRDGLGNANSPWRIVVLDVRTGETTRFGKGVRASWVDDDTLLIEDRRV